jgi:hypothetical protein
MESMMETKWVLLTVLVLAGLALWVVPRTRFARRLRMTVGLFYAINILGILVGIAGLALTLGRPDLVLEEHYYEVLLLPVFLSYMYFALLQIVQKSKEILDEKQALNMTQAAAATLPFAVFWVFLLYALYKETVLTGLIFFPLFVFFVLLAYSAHVLIFYRKN